MEVREQLRLGLGDGGNASREIIGVEDIYVKVCSKHLILQYFVYIIEYPSQNFSHSISIIYRKSDSIYIPI